MEIQARGAMASAVEMRSMRDVHAPCSLVAIAGRGCWRARRALSTGIRVAGAMALAVAMMLHVRWFLSLGEAAVERGSVDGDPGAGSDGVGGGDAVDARRACSIFIVFHL
jgi:hypothetical protein